MKVTNTKKKYIAFIDILGFKNLVESKSHNVVYKKIHAIVESLIKMEALFKFKKEEEEQEEENEWIKKWVFSDSIMLVSRDDSEFSADVIFLVTANIVAEALNQELLVKGSIAFGEFTADYENSIFFGKPLIDSYQLEENLKISSIVIHHTCEKKLKQMKYENINLLENGRCFNYLTPMKFGKVNHLHLNWLKYQMLALEKNEREEVFIKFKKLIETIYLEASGEPRLYIDNTIPFLEKCRDEYEANVRQ